MTKPTLEDMLDELKRLAEVDDIDPDAPLSEVDDIDSLDLMEWVYQAQETYALAIDESVFDDVDETSTLRSVFERVMSSAEAAITPV